jgi:hypothetical protein
MGGAPDSEKEGKMGSGPVIMWTTQKYAKIYMSYLLR